MSKQQISDRVRRLELRRRAVLDRLLASEPLVRGSLTKVLQRCGKPSCHCVSKPAHLTWRLMTSHSGKQRCQLVRQDDVERVQALVKKSKAFAEGLREIESIQREQKALLRVIREEYEQGYE